MFIQDFVKKQMNLDKSATLFWYHYLGALVKSVCYLILIYLAIITLIGLNRSEGFDTSLAKIHKLL